jgi:hypothetical protein
VLSLEQPIAALQSAMSQDAPFVVVSTGTVVGSSPAMPLFVATGDVAIGDWRFALDLADADDAASLLVFKQGVRSSVRTFAGQLAAWAEPGVFNVDPLATQAKLVKWVETAIANAADPALGPWYSDLANKLVDPAWTGVLVLNASLPSLPPIVQGTPAPGQRMVAHHVRINTSREPPGAPSAVSVVGGLIDYLEAPAVAVLAPASSTPPLLTELRALFTNSALSMYQAGVNAQSPL